MKWNEYTSLFDDVLNNDNNEAPYDNPEYVNYVKMNQSRSNRWLKSDVLNEELIKKIELDNFVYYESIKMCGYGHSPCTHYLKQKLKLKKYKNYNVIIKD